MTNGADSGFLTRSSTGLRQLGRSQAALFQGVTATLLPQRRNKMTNCPHSGFTAALDRGLSQLGRSQPLLVKHYRCTVASTPQQNDIWCALFVQGGRNSYLACGGLSVATTLDSMYF